MPIEKTKSTDTTAAGLVARTGASERGGAGGVFTVTCYDKDGNLKWEEKTHVFWLKNEQHINELFNNHFKIVKINIDTRKNPDQKIAPGSHNHWSILCQRRKE